MYLFWAMRWNGLYLRWQTWFTSFLHSHTLTGGIFKNEKKQLNWPLAERSWFQPCIYTRIMIYTVVNMIIHILICQDSDGFYCYLNFIQFQVLSPISYDFIFFLWSEEYQPITMNVHIRDHETLLADCHARNTD